jgi:protein-S-isoprenylcysteine O-methyltransferase Ste14
MAIALFGASTFLVLWGDMMLAVEGQGTPPWFDAPRWLVSSGPYAWLRTPMVTGTLGQVVGAVFITGSVIVVAFVPVIALVWNRFIRPPEEDLMQHFFGRSFELYRRGVRC